MGYKTDHWPICSWEEYAMTGTASHGQMSVMQDRDERQVTYPMMQGPRSTPTMDGECGKTTNMAVGPRNGTYNTTSTSTKLGGMGAGPTSMTGVLINTAWYGTS